MLTPALRKYISDKNFTARVFFRGHGKPEQFDINNLTSKDIATLLDMLEGDQSPENLTCDGELRGAMLASRVKYLNDVQDGLNALRAAYA